MEEVAKKKVSKKTELDSSKNYSIVGTGKSQHLVKDVVYSEVSSVTAEYLINKGFATLK